LGFLLEEIRQARPLRLNSFLNGVTLESATNGQNIAAGNHVAAREAYACANASCTACLPAGFEYSVSQMTAPLFPSERMMAAPS